MHTLIDKFYTYYSTSYLRGNCHGRVPFKAGNFVCHHEGYSLLGEPTTKNESRREKRSVNKKVGVGLDSNRCAPKSYVMDFAMEERVNERTLLLQTPNLNESANGENNNPSMVASVSCCEASLQKSEVDELKNLLEKAQTLLKSQPEENAA